MCGPKATSVLPSVLWENIITSTYFSGPERVTLQVPGGSITLFRYANSKNCYPNIPSVSCMCRLIDLHFQHDGKGFWVAINSPHCTSVVSTEVTNSLVARFEKELASAGIEDVLGEPGNFGCVLAMPFRNYLRAAYLTLIERGFKTRGLLEVATIFASRISRFKERSPEFKVLNQTRFILTCHRTLTVFWLYHVSLALAALMAPQMPRLTYFKHIMQYFPELEDETTGCFRTCVTNLRELVTPSQYYQFWEMLVKPPQKDSHHLLRFIYAVVQRYLRSDETRRRAWFINLALTALQQQTMRIRASYPELPPSSETQAYFYIQLVHAALVPYIVCKRSLFQYMAYPLFEETFRLALSPSEWTLFYSPQLWYSISAPPKFRPPDLKPLPDMLKWENSSYMRFFPDSNEPFESDGLVPELPSLEVLHFYRAITLEDAESVYATPTPAEVTSHARLLKYIHAHLILPGPFPSSQSIEESVSHHQRLLTAAPLHENHTPFYLTLVRTLLVRTRHVTQNSNDINPTSPPRTAVHTVADHDEEFERKKREKDTEENGSSAGERASTGEPKMGVEWEEWLRSEELLVLCWDEAWKAIGVDRLLEGVVLESNREEDRDGDGGGDGRHADERTLGGEKGVDLD
ncbi:hypothetical protein C7999DRAFT_44543 [Corynascus novoguineensis]|uniref:Uncharacterized protein n=1 Tax=Corynascus novoguineensis TaxID=1126955 RepID=A0AAN7HIW1_9PEZI|nr:hypothetical protein C7999DRAFT_44543 [Corynascus novoguineensis]